MSLDQLKPASTKKAKQSAIKVFNRFLEEEAVQMSSVDAAVRSDLSGEVFVALMDRFGMYLIRHRTKSGAPITRHTVMQYFRQVKTWLLERFPRSGATIEKTLLKKGKILRSFCVTRPDGKMVKQASPCTKDDLRRLLEYLYSNASVPADYQDVGLLALVWSRLRPHATTEVKFVVVGK